MTDILSVHNLSIQFGDTPIVHDISFDIQQGQTFALVGESGSGKSITALSILRLLDQSGVNYPSGKILFGDTDLLCSPIKTVRQICGDSISMIFQEPMTALNPLHTLEKQISEVLTLHQGLNKGDAKKKCIDLLNQVKIPSPETRLKNYPHELSGGQRQRVMIAMALANKPKLLIADEPTTALDVTVQTEILELLLELKSELGMSILLITHDLGVVKKYADKIAIMQAGRLVETGSTYDIFNAPKHEYTQHLLSSTPKGGPVAITTSGDEHELPILEAQQLKVSFPLDKPLWGKPKRWLHAVDNVDISVTKGHTLGIIGESGSGKSTLAMALLRLINSEGEIRFQGEIISGKRESYIRPFRKRMQVVFQDPFASLSPRMTISQIIAEGLHIHSQFDLQTIEEHVIRTLEEVGLDPADRNRYPHEFSGGQRQRVAIARALILEPELLFLDEPTSALDRAVQVQIIDLLRSLQSQKKLSYVFISHDLHIIKAISHDIAVMKDGKIMEYGPAEKVLQAPQHSYTQQLINATLD